MMSTSLDTEKQVLKAVEHPLYHPQINLSVWTSGIGRPALAIDFEGVQAKDSGYFAT